MLEARGEACAPTAETLSAIKLNPRRDGKVIYSDTKLPDTLPVEITDSSGDIDVQHVAALLFFCRGTENALECLRRPLCGRTIC